LENHRLHRRQTIPKRTPGAAIGATGEVQEINSDAASAAAAVVVAQADRRVVTAGLSINPVAPETRIVVPARPVPVIVVMTAAEAVVAQVLAEAIDRIAVLVRRVVVVVMTAVAVAAAATVTGHALSRLPLP
jgi:hypothetical protein